MTEKTPWQPLTRRQALTFIGAAGAVSLASLRGTTRTWAASCALSPAMTEGPYFVDELLHRSDITLDPSDGSVVTGVPLRLRINVLRSDDACAPAAGLRVDVWHTDAGGLYSDEAVIGTLGRKFLRGYEVTDENGAVEFTTIYPGWYPGRTIHIHFKVRAFDGAQQTYEFTSQLFFDDAVSDQVLALPAYDARGARDTTNASDAIYDGALLLVLADDGSGGYTGTFDVGLEGVPATSTGGNTCADLAACRAALADALPDPTTAADAKSRRVARRLARLNGRTSTALGRAASASGARQAKQYGKARAALTKLLATATMADAKGTLGVSLASLQQAAVALLALVPSA